MIVRDHQQISVDLGEAAPQALIGRAIRCLARMYRPKERKFVFTCRLTSKGPQNESLSTRYTATVLLGLRHVEQSQVTRALGGASADDVLDHLAGELDGMEDLGEVALTLWAARVWDHHAVKKAIARLNAMHPATRNYPTVETAWCLAALSEPSAAAGDDSLAEALANRLAAAQSRCGLFPHWTAAAPWLRAPIACFADQVYPILALSLHHALAGCQAGLEAAGRAAKIICDRQGRDGQWWWHYDVRTGRVVEGYPVYSVHQDAMAPMALQAYEDAGGQSCWRNVWKGLLWLKRPVEVEKPLIDTGNDIIWRKVARREPGRAVRHMQALACRIHPSLRLPGVETMFPPRSIDYESRPYHMGWILYAWRPRK